MSSRSCHMFYITFIVVVVIVFEYHWQCSLSFFSTALVGTGGGRGAMISTSSSSAPSAPSIAPALMNTGTSTVRLIKRKQIFFSHDVQVA